MGRAVLQYSHCTCDTVRVLGGLGAGLIGRWAGVGRAGTALGARRWAGVGARRQARGLTCARGARRRQAAGAGGTSVRHRRAGAGHARARGAGGRARQGR